jgi:hypothetical protein
MLVVAGVAVTLEAEQPLVVVEPVEAPMVRYPMVLMHQMEVLILVVVVAGVGQAHLTLETVAPVVQVLSLLNTTHPYNPSSHSKAQPSG